MLAKTKYNVGELVIVRKDGNDYNCEISDITIYIHSDHRKNYVSYLCFDIDNIRHITATKKDITRHIKLYKARKWLSKIFYDLYLKFDKLW